MRALVMALVAAGLALVVAVAEPFAGPAVAAASVSIPVSNLPGCGQPPDAGGWDVRDLVATGTRSESPLPVRPRSLRLGEPCSYDGSIAVTAGLADVPAPMVDEDEDGIDDPPEDSPLNLCVEYDTAGFTPVVADLAQIEHLCEYPVLAQLSGGPNQFKHMQEQHVAVLPTPGLPHQLTVTWLYEFDPLPSGQVQGVNFLLYCENVGGVLAEDDTQSVEINGASVPDIEFHLTCSTTSDVPIWVIASTWDEGGVVEGQQFGAVYYGGDLEIGDPSAAPGGYYGGTQGAEFEVGDLEALDPQMTTRALCSTSYQGGATTWVAGVIRTLLPASMVPDLEDPENPDWRVLQLVDLGITGCTHLNTLEVWICAYQGHGPDEYGCAISTWNADRFREGIGYTGSDGADPEELICTLNPDTPNCYEVLNPPVIDGTDFSVVCANPPAFEWLTFDWVPAVIGHYVECLVRPVNGLDRKGWVRTAWDESAGGALATVALDVFAAFSVSGACGVLGNGDFFGTDFTIDTCGWAWAGPVRGVLVVGIPIAMGVAMLSFMFRVVAGLPNKKIPAPF